MSRVRGEPRLAIDRKDRTGNYYIYYTDAEGQSREKSTFTRDREGAELYKAKWLIGRSVPATVPTKHEILITDALNYYMVTQLPEVKDGQRIKWAVSALLKYWQGKYLSEITKVTCREYVTKRKRAAETVRRELGVLAAAVTLYRNDGHFSGDVVVHKPAPGEGRVRWLEPEEAILLIKAARTVKRAAGHLPLFILIGVLTGQRKEAILSLTWEDVNFRHGYIDWNPIGRTRTRKQRPRTAIPKQLVKYLKQRRERYPEDKYVLTYRGRPIDDIKGSFAEAVARSGIPSDGEDKVVPHVLRHTCATWLMQSGVDKYEGACQ
ncbi:MAG: tyrosine-type recombinase/integrase [Sphingomonadaceae bacterium]